MKPETFIVPAWYFWMEMSLNKPKEAIDYLYNWIVGHYKNYSLDSIASRLLREKEKKVANLLFNVGNWNE